MESTILRGGHWRTNLFWVFVLWGLSLNAQVQVTGAISGNGSYVSLRTAFNAINAASQSGANILIAIQANVDEGANAAVLNAGTWNRLTIKPYGNRVISGNPSGGNGLITLNGADQVTIDGDTAAGNALWIRNTTTSNIAGTSAIRLQADACNNVISQCNITAAGSAANTGVVFIGTGTTTGNDNNLITACSISSDTVGFVANLIYSAGTSTTVDNSNISILGNNLYDFYASTNAQSAIFVASNSAAWNISNNVIFQTAPRDVSAGVGVYGIRVTTPSAGGYSVNGNTIGFASADQTGVMTYNNSGAATFRGIELTTNNTESSTQSNLISGIYFSTTATTTNGGGVFAGISVLAGQHQLGSLAGNTIGNNTTNTIVIATTTQATTSTRIVGIYAQTSNARCWTQNNIISGISTEGAPNCGYSIIGVYTSGTGATHILRNNAVGSLLMPTSIAAGSGLTTSGICNVYGLYNDATGNWTASANKVQHIQVYGSSASFFYGIQNNGGAGQDISIEQNIIDGVLLTGSGVCRGIHNQIASATLSVSGNLLRNFTVQNGVSGFTGILNSGGVTARITLNDNQLGDSTSDLVHFTIATSSALTGIGVTAGANTALLSITGNEIRGIYYDVNASNNNTLISNTATTFSQDISNNVFTALTLATTGSVVFISNNVALPSGGSQIINNNSTTKDFYKTLTGGSVTLLSATAASSPSSTIVNNNNQFSKINVIGNTTLNGWVQTDTGGATKTLNYNVFSNWTSETGTMTVMSVSGCGGNSEINGNTLTNLTTQAALTGISLGTTGVASQLNVVYNNISNCLAAGNLYGISSNNNTPSININSNVISNLSSTGASSTLAGIAVLGGTGTHQLTSNTLLAMNVSGASGPTLSGIWINAGATVKMDKNKIYDLTRSSTPTSSFVAGINCTGGQQVSMTNNIVGDIKSPLTSIASAAIRGISIGASTANSTFAVYHNTVYLNATSSGSQLGSCALYHTANTTATTANLILKNNILINLSAVVGSGNAICLQRSGTALQNFDLSSNNNLLYAGSPSAQRLIYHDGITGRQNLSNYQLVMLPREVSTVTENVSFVSTSGSSLSYLRPDPSVLSVVESGGLLIGTVPDDFNGQLRFGSIGYTGSGLAPDLGAYEQNGLYSDKPVLVSGALYGNGGYVNLGSAMTILNSNDQTGADIVVVIQGDTDEGTASVPIQSGNWNSMLIRAAAGNRLVTGNTIAGSPLIDLNGADRVTIDGINAGGISLTFQNTTVSAVAGTSTLRFISDATQNTVRNLTLKGATTAPNAGVVFFATGTTTGNDNNTISNCTITAALTGGPTHGIYCAGTSVDIDNSNNQILSNQISDCFNPTASSSGIQLASNASAWNISGNKIFQTANRSVAAANLVIYGIRINTPSGVGYTLQNNVVGYSSASASGYSSFDGSYTTSYRGIEMQVGSSVVSSIQGNTISGIQLATTQSTTGTNGVLSGISVLSGWVNIGNTIGNVIGSDSQSNAIQVSATAATATRITGIYVLGANNNYLLQNNVIGGITTGGSATSGYAILGLCTSGTAASFTIQNNSVGSASVAHSISVGTSGLTTAACQFYGIYNDATGPQNILSNTVRNCSVWGSAGSFYYGIQNNGGSGETVVIDNNQVINGYSQGSGVFRPIHNAVAAQSLSMSGNSIKGLSLDHASASFTAILNSGAVVNTIHLSNNILGDSGASLVNFLQGSTTLAYGILNSAGTASGSLNIQGNAIRGWVYQQPATASVQLITNQAGMLTRDLSSNTFSGLSINSSGSFTFINDNVALPATGSQTVSYNLVSGGFSKTLAGGTVSFFVTNATSANGASLVGVNNNFSNINVVGNTVLNGWVQSDLGANYKLVFGNTFNNISAGTASVTVMSLNGFGASSMVANNTINSVSAQAAITGISIGSTGTADLLTVSGNSVSNVNATGVGGNVVALISANPSNVVQLTNTTVSNCTSTGNNSLVVGIQFSNGNGSVSGSKISGLSSTGTGNVVLAGIYISGGNSIQVSGNKVYDLSINGSGSSPVAYGLWLAAGLQVNVFNNVIGDLKAPFSSNVSALRGIMINAATLASTFGIYHNTLYLNATSNGANFGTAALYHLTSATATTANLILRNNILINTSTPNGVGVTAAYQRSNSNLANYDLASNNNLLYAGTPANNRLLYYDSTNRDQSLVNVKARLTPRESASQTENTIPLFQSTAGAQTNYLRLAAGTTSYAESGAVLLTDPAVNTDYWGVGRPFANPINFGTAPDIGASEFDGFIQCSTPTTQPTAWVSGATTATTAAASFTAASGNPTGYLVVRSIGALNGNPTDGTPYTTGATLANGVVVQYGNNTACLATGLSPNTTYTFTVFSYYTAVNCGGGPKYNTTLPLTGTATTCSAAPTGAATQSFCGGTATIAQLSATGSNIKWYADAQNGAPLVSSTPLLNGSTYYATQTVAGCESPLRLAVLAVVGVNSIGGAVLSSQSICQGSPVADLVLTGYNGQILKWQKSTQANFVPAVDIAQTSSTLTGAFIGQLNTSTYFRAVIQDGGCPVVMSTPAYINVSTPPVPGVVMASQSLCSGSAPADLTLTSYSGNIAYWQMDQQPDFATATTIPNPTSVLAGNTIGPLLQTHYFRAVLQNGACPVQYAEAATVQVDAPTVAGVLSADQTVCSGFAPTDIVVTQYIGSIVKWQMANNPAFDTAVDISHTSDLLSGSLLGAITATTYVRAVVQNGVCPAQYSPYVSLNVYNTTWDGTSWSNGLPDATKTINFTGNYTANQNLEGCSMNVMNQAIVVIPSGYDVVLQGALKVEHAARFTLNNNANLIQHSEIQNSGNIQVNRDSSRLFRLDYTLWSSPVSGNQSLLQFSPLTQVAPNSRFYTYQAATALYQPIANPANAFFAPAQSYLIRMPNNWVPYAVGATPASWTGTFIGTPNNGSVIRQDLVDGGTRPYRYNAVGNPYPSAMSMVDFINANSNNITGTLWFWRKTNDASNQLSYSTCTTIGCTLNNGIQYADPSLLSVGQGFLVEVLAGQTSVTFNNSMRRSTHVNQFFKQRNMQRYWLALRNADQIPLDEFMVAYISEGSYGYDAGKDGVCFTDKPNALFSTADRQSLTIDARPSFDVNDRIPLSLRLAQPGFYELSLSQFEGLFDQQAILVEDTFTHQVQPLQSGPYRFWAPAGVQSERFVLRYLPTDNKLESAPAVVVYGQQHQLGVQATGSAITQVRVFDVRGAIVAAPRIDSTFTVSVDLDAVAQQILLVEVTLANGQVSMHKVIL